MRQELQPVLEEAKTLAREELPKLLGELEEVRVTALARLTLPVAAATRDESLDVSEAARRLGVSTSYLYHHSRDFSFARHQGRKLLFSARGIEAHLAKQRRS